MWQMACRDAAVLTVFIANIIEKIKEVLFIREITKFTHDIQQITFGCLVKIPHLATPAFINREMFQNRRFETF